MASRSLNDLTPELKEKVLLVDQRCEENGVSMLFYCTLRSLDEQARLFRQGRSYASIVRKMDKLTKKGYGYLSAIIELVGPQRGSRKLTNAAPGESWHNYKEAVDGVPLRDGKALWSSRHQEWEIYGEAAQHFGLNWAGTWRTFKEFPHIQFRSGGNPLKHYDSDQIKEILITNGLI